MISHIDNASDIREAVPSLEELPFDTWCEFFLPYRVNNEPLDYIMKNADYLSHYLDTIRLLKKYNLSQQEWIYLASSTFMPSTRDVAYELPGPANGRQLMDECIANATYCQVIYTTTSDISLKVNPFGEYSLGHLYLAVFNSRVWKPIAWANIKWRKAKFQAIGRGIVYLPVYYSGHTKIQSGYPFILHNDGSTKILEPNHQELTELNLTRKYPYNSRKIKWQLDMEGLMVLGSNYIDFNMCDTIGIVNRPIHDNSYVTIENKRSKKHRYYKIITPQNKKIDIAEIAFYSSGDRIEPGKSFYNYNTSQEEILFDVVDNDPLTYATISGNIFIDLMQTDYVSQIIITPRNDDNDIVPGEVYELFYMDIDGWKSLGRKEADSPTITFKDVLADALYWLRNHTKGQEERVFTYQNDVVSFW